MKGEEETPERSVLVVDDQATQRLLASAALKGGGFRVIEAANGEEAIRRFVEHDVAAIVLDVVMPDLDGFGVCQRIREDPSGVHVPIMMMTARDDDGAIERAFDVGATDFVRKPINASILVHRMRYMLRAAETAAELRRSETLLGMAEELALIGSWEWDGTSRSLRWSRGFDRLFPGAESRSSRELAVVVEEMSPPLADILRRVVEEPDSLDLPLSIEHRASEAGDPGRFFESRIDRRAAPGDGGSVISGIVQDVTLRERSEREIRRLAYFDRLTGLPNRASLGRYVDQIASRSGPELTALHVDIDGFRRINDLASRSTGDAIIREIGTRIGTVLSHHDLLPGGYAQGFSFEDWEAAEDCCLGRLTGDEFVALVRAARPSAAVSLGEAIREALGEPYRCGPRVYRLSASLGIASLPADDSNLDSLLRHADAAMQEAKRAGGNRCQVYAAEIHDRVLERLSIENDLRQALERDELEVYYQPKVNITLNQVVGMEALVRWHAGGAVVSPAKFIPIAEESELIEKIGHFVLKKACQQTKGFRELGVPGLELSVNLSARQLDRENLPQEVGSILEETGLEASELCLEVTESALVRRQDHGIRVLGELRELGCKIAVDDFGTGYSSLSYLKRLPVDALKVDQSFVRELGTDRESDMIVEAVIRLAQTLGLGVVAEGVERPDQEEKLRNMGCAEIQGFLYGKPLAAPAFEAWLAERLAVSTVLRAAR